MTGCPFPAEDTCSIGDGFSIVSDTFAGSRMARVLREGWGSLRGWLSSPEGDARHDLASDDDRVDTGFRDRAGFSF